MRWWWSRRSRPQGSDDLNATTPVRQYRCNDPAPQVQHLQVLVHIRWKMTSFGLFGLAEIVEVDRFWIGSGIPAAWRRAAVELTSLLRSPSGSHMREREGRGVAHVGKRRGELFQGTPSIHMCQTLLQGVSLYSGDGETLPPTKEPRGGQGGAREADGQP
jgi:hypothetical protein